jgi:hypothetical protein
MSSNRFYGPLAKLYEGPLNDIRQKVVEEGWYGRPVTEDFKWPVPESTVKTGPDMHGTGPSPSLTEAHFTEVYGEPLTPIEAPQIEAPKIEAPRIEGPRIDP